nr:reverse transcriptase domain-containing protein [Tanacetum cinerariifolium]
MAGKDGSSATLPVLNSRRRGQALIDRGFAAALAERDADRSRNGDNSNDSVKFASCTLQGSAFTWWNSHMRAVGQDVAYAMPWAALKRMIIDKYYPRDPGLEVCGGEGGGVMGEVVGEVERGWEVEEMWHGSWREF